MKKEEIKKGLLILAATVAVCVTAVWCVSAYDGHQRRAAAERSAEAVRMSMEVTNRCMERRLGRPVLIGEDGTEERPGGDGKVPSAPPRSQW